MKCALCEDCGWVCEDHAEGPWAGKHACDCGGAGCPAWPVTPAMRITPPRPPEGFRIEVDKDGWRH